MSAHEPASTVHASAVVCGDTGILIRGPSGSGKSRLAFALMLAGRAGQISPTLLVGDDRVFLTRQGEKLQASAPDNLRGLIEIRGLGIRRCDFSSEAVLGLVVDLAAVDAERLPAPEALSAELHGITLSRIPVAANHDALPLVLAALTTVQATRDATEGLRPDDCQQGFGNHISPMMASRPQ